MRVFLIILIIFLREYNLIFIVQLLFLHCLKSFIFKLYIKRAVILEFYGQFVEFMTIFAIKKKANGEFS